MSFTKDELIGELIEFFNDELRRDRAGTEDWIAQGDRDAAEFIAAVEKLKRELSLRDSASATELPDDR